MVKRLGATFIFIMVVWMAFMMGIIFARSSLFPASPQNAQAATATDTPVAKPAGAATETIPPYTPLASVTAPRSATPLVTFTPSKTLRPPPTFEPPTNTPLPSPIPSLTPTFTPFALATLPGLNSGFTATPVGTPGCVKRKDWKLTYEVQANDALITIATKFNTTADELAQANCLANKNVIVVGQILLVPGTSLPVQAPWVCIPIQNLTPQNGTMAVGGTGNLVFHWFGPQTPKNLIRMFAPDGTKIEYVVELRQDYTIDLSTIKPEGTYTWYVYPLDANFQGVCHEGGPWTFRKAVGPTSTPMLLTKVP